MLYVPNCRTINMNGIEIKRVIEFSDFFPDESPLDITSVLKTFSRDTLVRMATLLSLQYGNMFFPNNEYTLFSHYSQKHMDFLNKQCSSYFKRIGLPSDGQVVLCTFRTSLELWRNIFAIKIEEFQATIASEDEELTLFKIILALNEKIFKFTHSLEPEKEMSSVEENIFLNSFLTNDCNNYDFQAILQTQIYYFKTLIDYIPKNPVLLKASERLLSQWGISSWKEYFSTILFLAHETEKYRVNNPKGIPVINVEQISKRDQTGYFSPTLIENLSIDENEFIPYDENGNAYQRDNNIDYRIFRSKPFVKLENSSDYVIVNIQLLCERLFNSLFFDFSPLINGKDENIGFFNFNKDFTEKILFRNTMFQCIPEKTYTFPTRDFYNTKEDKDEPDFYARKNGNLLIMECKSIKMNGAIRDKGDYKQMMENLLNKLALKTYNIDPNRQEFKKQQKPIGIGQLVKHIDSIEADTFQWDANIPNDVAYYPILVLEDIRFFQPGLLSILNKNFIEVAKVFPDLELNDIAYRPVMAISINTLFLYDNLIRKRGLTNLIDAFLEKEATIDEYGNYKLLPLADFDAYLRKNSFNKSVIIGKRITDWLKDG
ncbi:hypothetical protein DWX38_04925 [Bacteroides clarus]|uniref:Uncharacterized protein n=2 Tax=Bacteroides clarus TaxID=626929 RepID=A0A412N6S8_9BACE|nr:hypothetical protein DWX38_04925 [Bacteroides clarus]